MQYIAVNNSIALVVWWPKKSDESPHCSQRIKVSPKEDKRA
jgi:hypothetical protein